MNRVIFTSIFTCDCLIFSSSSGELFIIRSHCYGLKTVQIKYFENLFLKFPTFHTSLMTWKIIFFYSVLVVLCFYPFELVITFEISVSQGREKENVSLFDYKRLRHGYYMLASKHRLSFE